ncbi:Nuclear factor related to kappa-B-binding protein [Corchorus capsularis]|uniref:Nuclear factor related to kappa-B-binding protein n=1 Tax=Corchorus capsularis TaxID=210143 RepID=A0A1R3ISJ1_COCAP|nr:Nuclear factor related to kappa-B-binding protein [Corchorus capsularis]
MAADQRRKRLNGASITGCTSRDQYRNKKKKLESPQKDLNSKSCISLEWDGKQRKVVAKREQIGLSRRHLRPFIDSTPNLHKVLADVLTLPREIFDLENLREVLSYEVWQTHLSENERNLLMQFLPTETDQEEVLQALLAGDNLHFGNPFLKWGASLCSGHLHPDAVIQEEQRLKAEKKAYYSELQNYHNDIIEHLQKLKEKWESCKDPEQEIVQKLWRSRRVGEKRDFSHSNESGLGNAEQDVAVTSESSSWVADDKACSSDNQNSSAMRGGEPKRRMHEKGFKKEKGRILSTASDDALTVEAKGKKGDKVHKRNIQQTDGAKYMSYFKISKKQHELIKNMKQSGRNLQSRSLNRVLGDIDSLHVQPYEVFMEEEQRKLREHWLKLAKEDLPAAYANWREVQLQKWEITRSLEQDMKEKLNLVLEDDEEEDVGQFEDQEDEEEDVGQLEDQEDEEEDVGQLEDQEDDGGPNLDVVDTEKEDPEMLLEDQKDTEATDSESSMQEEGESGLALLHNQSPQQNSSIDSGNTCNRVDMESENNENLSKSDDASLDVSEHSENLNTADATVSQQEVHVSSAENVWPADSMPHSFHDSTAGHEFTSARELPLTHEANEDQQNQMIDLESDLHEESTGKVLLHGHSEDGSFSSYANQDRNELLQSFFKDQGMLSYHSGQKQTGLGFQPQKHLLMEDGHFNGQFQEHLQSSLPLEEGQKRQTEVYMQQNMSESMYSQGDRYLTPRQEHLPSGNMQDWAVNPARMSVPFPHQLNGGDLLSQNWYNGEHQVQVRGGWAGSDGFTGPSHSIATGSSADQNLFSVISQCSQLGSSSRYESMGSTGQFISQRNNGMVSGGTSGIIGNSLQQAVHPLNYLGGRDATTSLIPDDMGWMSLQHQNSALHDSMGKPYLRSWNQ